MEWRASTANQGSIAAAQGLGFEEIGVIRYKRCLRDGKARGKKGGEWKSGKGADWDWGWGSLEGFGYVCGLLGYVRWKGREGMRSGV